MNFNNIYREYLSESFREAEKSKIPDTNSFFDKQSAKIIYDYILANPQVSKSEDFATYKNINNLLISGFSNLKFQGKQEEIARNYLSMWPSRIERIFESFLSIHKSNTKSKAPVIDKYSFNVATTQPNGFWALLNFDLKNNKSNAADTSTNVEKSDKVQDKRVKELLNNNRQEYYRIFNKYVILTMLRHKEYLNENAGNNPGEYKDFIKNLNSSLKMYISNALRLSDKGKNEIEEKAIDLAISEYLDTTNLSTGFMSDTRIKDIIKTYAVDYSNSDKMVVPKIVKFLKQNSTVKVDQFAEEYQNEINKKSKENTSEKEIADFKSLYNSKKEKVKSENSQDKKLLTKEDVEKIKATIKKPDFNKVEVIGIFSRVLNNKAYSWIDRLLTDEDNELSYGSSTDLMSSYKRLGWILNIEEESFWNNPINKEKTAEDEFKDIVLNFNNIQKEFEELLGKKELKALLKDNKVAKTALQSAGGALSTISLALQGANYLMGALIPGGTLYASVLSGIFKNGRRLGKILSNAGHPLDLDSDDDNENTTKKDKEEKKAKKLLNKKHKKSKDEEDIDLNEEKEAD